MAGTKIHCLVTEADVRDQLSGSLCEVAGGRTRDTDFVRRSIVVRTLVSTGELSLSCVRLLTGWVTILWLSRPLSVSQRGQLSHHPSGVGKWVVVHVIR